MIAAVIPAVEVVAVVMGHQAEVRMSYMRVLLT